MNKSFLAARDEILNCDAVLANIFQGEKVTFLFRTGSSLMDDFNEESDLDYIAVLPSIRPAFINAFPGRVSPVLDEGRFKPVLREFFWRMQLESVCGHPVTLTLYTDSKFFRYVAARSGAKMYLLREHKLLVGDFLVVSRLINDYPPNVLTAENDYYTLVDDSYEQKFLWAWRSVALLEEGIFLTNKGKITAWVDAHYSSMLHSKEFLKTHLRGLLFGKGVKIEDAA